MADYKVSFILPLNPDPRRPAPDYWHHLRAEALDFIVQHAARRFGGASVTPQRGVWIDKSGRLIEEASEVIWIVTQGYNLAFLKEWSAFMADVARRITQQDCVMWFIEPVATVGFAEAD